MRILHERTFCSKINNKSPNRASNLLCGIKNNKWQCGVLTIYVGIVIKDIVFPDYIKY